MSQSLNRTTVAVVRRDWDRRGTIRVKWVELVTLSGCPSVFERRNRDMSNRNTAPERSLCQYRPIALHWDCRCSIPPRRDNDQYKNCAIVVSRRGRRRDRSDGLSLAGVSVHYPTTRHSYSSPQDHHSPARFGPRTAADIDPAHGVVVLKYHTIHRLSRDCRECDRRRPYEWNYSSVLAIFSIARTNRNPKYAKRSIPTHAGEMI